MLVANFEKEASSAALGAQEAIAVTMTQDSSFITMMFSNLYSNQVLAAVREPICNAWDAMIDADKENQHIDITFDRETGDLAIRDYGKGIAKNMIGKIYGVIGGSTKRNNNKATGGFGLGSKAPWALVDSFRVTSRHEGVMTVYNMAKATLESNGEPMITPMVDAPCSIEDTGLTVEMRIPEANLREAQDYIQYAVLQGGIKARWNGEEMCVCDLGIEPGSYITNDYKWYNDRFMANDEIFIRYGTVVYPVLRVPGTKKAIELLEEFMGILSINKVLIQAAPGTLGLTPARESLSSGKLTEDGITQLCLDLIKKIETDITDKLPLALAKLEKDLKSGELHNLNGYTDSTDLVRWSGHLNGMIGKFYRSRLGQSYQDTWESRLQLAEHVGWKIKAKERFGKHFHFVNKYRHFLKHDWEKWGVKSPFSDEDSATEYLLKTQFDKLVTSKVIKQVHRAGFNTKHLKLISGSSYSMDQYATVQHLKTYEKHHTWFHRSNCETLDVLLETLNHPVMVIGPPRVDVKTLRAVPKTETQSWNSRKNMFYIPVSKDTDKEELKTKMEALKKFGLTVWDLTIEHEWDPIVIERKAKEQRKRDRIEKAKATRAAKRAALLAANGGVAPKPKPKHVNAMGSLSNFIGKSAHNFKDIKPEQTTDTPLFFVEESDVRTDFITHYYRIEWLTPEELEHGVVVRNKVEENMAIKRGAVDGKEYFAKKLYAIVNEPGFKKYFTKQRQLSIKEQFEISSQTVKLFKIFGIPLKGMEKLTHNVRYEHAMALFSSRNNQVINYAGFAEADGEVRMQATSMAKYKLEQSNVITKLLALKNDEMVRNILRVGHYTEITMTEILQRYPERKAALKSIVLSAIKSNSGK